LLLELGHAVEPTHAGDAIEYPGELGVLGNLALVEHDMRLGIDAGRDEGGRHLADRARQLGWVLPGGDGVQVNHAIAAVVALRQLDESLDRAEIIAEMQIAGRLHAGKDEMLERHDTLSLNSRRACHGACPAARAVRRARAQRPAAW